MATVLTISDGTTSVNLDTAGTIQTLRDSFLAPPAGRQITYAGSRYRDGLWPGSQYRDNSAVTADVVLQGSSRDDLWAKFTVLQKLLEETTRYWISGGREGAPATLSLQLNGMTYAVVKTIKSGQVDPGSWLGPVMLSTAPKAISAKLILECEPHWREAADVTSTTNNVANDGGAITISNVRGETPAAIKLTVHTDQTISSVARMIAGRRTRGTIANFKHQFQGETGAFTGYTTSDIATTVTYSEQASATASNGKFGRWNNAGGAITTPERIVRVAITANLADHYGKFRVLMRAKYAADIDAHCVLYYGTANTPTLQTSVGAITLQLATASYTMVDLGIIEWPDVGAPVGVSVSTLVMEFAIAFAATNSSIDIDYFRIIPVDEQGGYLDLSLPVATSLAATNKLVADGTIWPTRIYVTDTSNALLATLTGALTQMGGSLLMAPGTNLWLVYLDACSTNPNVAPASDVLADTSDWTFAYRPQYSGLRGA